MRRQPLARAQRALQVGRGANAVEQADQRGRTAHLFGGPFGQIALGQYQQSDLHDRADDDEHPLGRVQVLPTFSLHVIRLPIS